MSLSFYLRAWRGRMEIRNIFTAKSSVIWIFLFTFWLFPYGILAAASEEQPSGEGPLGYPEKGVSAGDRLLFVGNINAYYNVSDQAGSGTIAGGGVSVVLGPGYRINDDTSFTLLYDGGYSRRRDFYSDEIGPRETTETMRHSITPMFRFNFGERGRLSLTPSIFYSETWNKDVDGGGWDDGLYNYRDKGAGLDFGIRYVDPGDDGRGRFRLGVQVYDREYPNYRSLLDLATGLGIEEDERDYLGILFRMGYRWTGRSGLSWGGQYYLLAKRLEDKKVVDSNGILTQQGQRDYLQDFRVEVSYLPEFADGLLLGLELGGILNDSNQNYYDGMGTTPLADDVFIAGFYDYISFRVCPRLSYKLSYFPLTLNLEYSYQRTNYSKRMAQDTSGAYKSDKQHETRHDITLGARYGLRRNLDVYARWQHLEVDSNNDYTGVYQYSHTVNNYSVGLSWIF